MRHSRIFVESSSSNMTLLDDESLFDNFFPGRDLWRMPGNPYQFDHDFQKRMDAWREKAIEKLEHERLTKVFFLLGKSQTVMGVRKNRAQDVEEEGQYKRRRAKEVAKICRYETRSCSAICTICDVVGDE